ncbi:hypothetical protein GTW71_13540 [Streptomyces sp. SID6041]|nr:hypothetical protein [Streptomyces sp. SID6041]
MAPNTHPVTVPEWPKPKQAYAEAPSITREFGWVARTATQRPFGTEPTREFWLRKAALLDRIALTDNTPNGADEAARRAARHLMDIDDAAVICNPRHYVRQQYAHWNNHQ